MTIGLLAIFPPAWAADENGATYGNVAIGLIRKRASGIAETEYLKMNILHLNTPDQPSVRFHK